MNEDSVYIRLGRRFQRIPADTRGWYLLFVNGELFLSREHSGLPKPFGVVIDQIGTMLTVAEYEISGRMNLEPAMNPKVISFGYIKAHCELPSRRELLQMYEQKNKFPEFVGWLWSKEQHDPNAIWLMHWFDGYMNYGWNYNRYYVRRVFHISIKSLFI